MAINEKQKRFVDEYLIDLNATQAAIRAGYSAKTAEQIGHQLLKKTSVREHLSTRQNEIAESTEITPEMVVKELAKIGFANIRKAVKWSPVLGMVEHDGNVILTNGVQLVDSDELDDDTAAAVAEVSQTAQGIKIKFHDKRAALVDIGRHLGMFTDKVNLGGQEDNPLNVNVNAAPKLTKEEWLKAHGLGTATGPAK